MPGRTKLVSLALFAAGLVLPSSAGAADPERTPRPCLSYEAAVTLTGRLERRTYPGRPNYESIRNGDEPETGFYLKLRSAVCTTGRADSIDSSPQQNVKLIQLVLDEEGYRALRPLLGRTVMMRGLLFAQHTGHHHAALLLQNPELVGRAR